MKSAGTMLLFLFLSLTVYTQNRSMFVVWGDSQFQNENIFEEAISNTAKLHPNFVLHVGDMIHGYTYDHKNAAKQWVKFRKQIKPLACEFLPTPGNHDITTAEIYKAYTDVWGENRLNYSYTYKDIKIIVLNQFEKNIPFYKLSAEQNDWFMDELKNTPAGIKIFISMHAPVFLKENTGWEAIHEELQKHNVKAVFSGHYHMYFNQKIDGIEYFCLNTSGNMGANDNFLTGSGHQFLIVNSFADEIYYSVFSDGRIYEYNIVEPGAREKYSKYYNNNYTIPVSDEDFVNGSKSVSINVINNSDINRIFDVKWLYKNYSWKFEPEGYVVSVKPKDTVVKSFAVTFPSEQPDRNEMPGVYISSDLSLPSGYNVITDYTYTLFAPPKGYAAKSNDEVTIDAELSEPSWEKAAVITGLVKNIAGDKAEEQTYVKVLYDENNLYVGIKCVEPNPEGMSLSAYGDLPLVFGDDDIELFIDHKNDYKNFYRIMVNANGIRLDSGPKGRYTFKYNVQTRISDNAWFAEFKIPFSEIDTHQPGKGTEWGFNIRRHRQQADYVQSDWSKMRTHPPYQPEYFGKLIFR